jgi:acyl phosphate:glycerol-3-phosphate acyltransferase
VTWGHVLWVVGGYVAGTFPSTYIVLRAHHAPGVIRLARREDSEGDAHILIRDHLGGKWAALAATMDVLKGLAYALAASRLGDLPPAWLAGVGVAVVVGHSFPPYARALAGRGLAAAAGVYLAVLPIEMVIAGVVTLAGIIVRWTPVASTIGFASVPAVAAVRGQPAALVAMSAGILAIIVLRRLEGIGDVVRGGVPWRRALYYRAVHDASGPPRPGRGAASSTRTA